MSKQLNRGSGQSSSIKSKRQLQREALESSIRPVVEGLEKRQLLTTAGLLDTTFAGAGFTSTGFTPAGSSNKAQAIAVETPANGGGYVAVGNSGTGSAEIVRYNPDGSVAWTTSTPTSTFSGNVVLNAVALDASGNIVVAGQISQTNHSPDFFVARYTSAGVLDTSFDGGTGFTTTDFHNDVDTATSVAIDGSGNIYLAGTVTDGGATDFGVAAYTAAGIYQNQVTEAVGSGNAQATAMVLDGSNLIVAGSAMNSSGDTDFALQLFSASNTLTPGATTLTDISSHSTDSANAIAVIPSSGGNVVVAGDANGKIALAEYTSSGVYSFSVATSISATATGVAVQPGGAVVVSATGTSGSNKAVELARFIPSAGAAILDSSFGTGGISTFTFTNASNAVNGVAVDGSKIVLAGFTAIPTTPNSTTQFLVARVQGNNAPVITNASISLTAVSETPNPSNPANPGDSVASLVTQLNTTDPDFGALKGIAITSVDNTNGQWQYTTNDGSNWTNIYVGSALMGVLNVSATNALLLAPDAGGMNRLRFVPNTYFNTDSPVSATSGPTPTATLLAWDQSAGTSGSTYDTTLADGNNAFSSGASPATASVAVTSVNQAPTVAVVANQTVDVNTQASILGVSVADVDGGTGNETITLTASAGTLTLATTVVGGLTSASGNGTSTVTATGTLAQINATLAAANGLTYFASTTSAPNPPNTITVNINDNGNSGNGGPQSGSATINVTVSAVSTVWVDSNWVISPGGDVSPAGLSFGDTVQDSSGAVTGKTFGIDAFSTIQDGINAVASGGMVNVEAGTYISNGAVANPGFGGVYGINIDKPLSLIGPNATFDPNGSTTPANGQAVILPGTNDPNVNDSNMFVLVGINSSNVTIEGLTLDGDNATSLGSYNDPSSSVPGVVTSIDGQTINAASGIGSYGAFTNLNVSDNVLRHFSYDGIGLNSDNTSLAGNTISKNYIFGLSDDYHFGDGIDVSNNLYANITGNVMNDVRTGVQPSNFSQAIPVGGTASISDNTITASRNGIFYNLFYSQASAFDVSSNKLYGLNDSNSRAWNGILVESQQNAVSATFTDNTIDGSAVTDIKPNAGVNVWNTPTTGTIEVTGGTITGATYGVWVNTYEGSNGNADNTQVTISGVSISAQQAGVYVEDSPENGIATASATIENNTSITTGGGGTGVLVSGAHASATITGNAGSIFGNAIGIDVNGGTASITSNHIYDNTTGISIENGGSATVTGNDFTGTTANGTDLLINSTAAANPIVGGTLTGDNFGGSSYFIKVGTAQNLDATGATFNGLSAGSNLALDYGYENEIVDYLDYPSLGYVSLNPTAVYVAASSESATAGAIQRGVNVAPSSGGTVNVQAGSFVDAIDIPVSLTLTGAGQGSTVVYPSAHDPSGPNGSLESPIILIDASNVTVQNLTLDGQNPSRADGIDASTGIITDWNQQNSLTGMTVKDVTVQNVYLRGIEYSDGNDFGTGTIDFENDTVTNVQGDSSNSIGIFNFGGSGTIANNTISGTPGAISTNWSNGTQIDGNIITNSDGGIDSSNNGGAGGVGDEIFNNTITGNGAADSDGIDVFAPYVTESIHDNTISNVATGLIDYGSQTNTPPSAPSNITFTHNSVDLSGVAGGVGALVTTSLVDPSFGFASVQATFDDNTIQNVSTGIEIQRDPSDTTSGATLTTANATVDDNNSITSSGDGIDITGGATADISGNSITAGAIGIKSQFASGDVTVDNNLVSMGGGATNGIDAVGTTGALQIDGNTVTGGAGFVGITADYAGTATIDNNQVTNAGTSVSAGTGFGIGVEFDTANQSAEIGGNTLIGTAFDAGGIEFSDAGNASNATITGNSVTGYQVGIDVAEFGGGTADATIGGTGPGVSNTITGADTAILVTGAGASAAISNNNTTIEDSNIGADVEDGATASIDGNVFSGNGTDVLAGATGDVTSLTGNTLTGTQFVEDLNPGDTIDATTDTFNVGSGNAAVAGTSLTPTEGYAAEDRITDYLDNPADGYVELNASNVYVTQKSENTTSDAIQRGVNVAPAPTAGTVNVQNGTFVGQIEITKNLTLLGQSEAGTIIQGAANMPLSFTTSDVNKPIVYIHDATGVNVEQLTVDGNGLGATNYRYEGIGYHNAGGLVQNTTIEHIRNNPLDGDQEGVAIYAYDDNSSTQSLTVKDNNIFDYQKNGMVIAGAGLTGDVEGNTVTGAGPTTSIAQNGIELGFGAGGTINDNTISGNSYTTASVDSTGILVFQSAAGTSITNNTMSGSDIGIYASSTSGNVPITSNTVTGSPGAGILIDQGTFTVTGNTLSGGVGDGGTANNTGDGIDVDDSQNGTTIQNNLIGTNTGDGVYIDGSVTDTSSLAVNNNSISGNTTAGVDNESALTVDATNNWWGNANGPTTAANSFGTPPRGDKIVGPGVTNFTPWLTSGANSVSPPVPGFYPGTASISPIHNSEGTNFGSIQAAINGSPAGDTITVGPGIYVENVSITKNIKIIGAGDGSNPASNTVVESASAGSPVFSVTGSGTIVTLNGLYITGGSVGKSAGVSVGAGASATVSHVAVNDPATAIGIDVAGTAIIDGDTLSNNGVGLQVESTGNATVEDGSSISDNATGILVSSGGSLVANDGTTTIEDNTTTGIEMKGGSANLTGATISGSPIGALLDGTGATLTGGTLTGSGTGTGVQITGNDDAADGIEISSWSWGATNTGASAQLTGDTITASTTGVEAESTGSITLQGVSISGASTGVKIDANASATIEDNSGTPTTISAGGEGIDTFGLLYVRKSGGDQNAVALQVYGMTAGGGHKGYGIEVESGASADIENTELGIGSQASENGNSLVVDSGAGAVTVSGDSFLDNTGAGISMAGGTVTVSDSSFSNADLASTGTTGTPVYVGTGISVNAGTLHVLSTTMSNMDTAVYDGENPTESVDSIFIGDGTNGNSDTFSNNTTAIDADTGSLTVSDAGFTDNATGIDVSGDGVADIIGSSFTDDATGIIADSSAVVVSSNDTWAYDSNETASSVVGVQVTSGGSAHVSVMLALRKAGQEQNAVAIESSGALTVDGGSQIGGFTTGIEVDAGNATIDNSTIGTLTKAGVTYVGGQGVYSTNTGGQIAIQDTQFVGNTTSGVIINGTGFVPGTTATISGSTFTDNAIAADVNNDGVLDLTDNTFNDNTTGIYANSSVSVTSSDNLIDNVGDTAATTGMQVTAAGSLNSTGDTIVGATVGVESAGSISMSHNDWVAGAVATAGQAGYGLQITGGTATIEDSTFGQFPAGADTQYPLIAGTGNDTGIEVTGGNATIDDGNNVTGNNEAGIVVTKEVDSASPTFIIGDTVGVNSINNSPIGIEIVDGTGSIAHNVMRNDGTAVDVEGDGAPDLADNIITGGTGDIGIDDNSTGLVTSTGDSIGGTTGTPITTAVRARKGSMDMTADEFAAAITGVEVDGGNATISGGTIENCVTGVSFDTVPQGLTEQGRLIDGAVLQNNTTGIEVAGGTVTVDDSSITGGTTGILVDAGQLVTVQDSSTISLAATGVDIEGGTADINNSSILDCTIDGVKNDSETGLSSVSLTGSTLSDNPTGIEMSGGNDSDSATLDSNSYIIIPTGGVGVLFDGTGGATLTGGTISADNGATNTVGTEVTGQVAKKHLAGVKYSSIAIGVKVQDGGSVGITNSSISGAPIGILISGDGSAGMDSLSTISLPSGGVGVEFDTTANGASFTGGSISDATGAGNTVGIEVTDNLGKKHTYIGHVTLVKPTIGVDVAGGATIVGDTIGENTTGILVESTGNATIGDSTPGDGNDIYGNTASGIEFTAGSSGSITDNDFGNGTTGPVNGTDLLIHTGAGTVSINDGNQFAGTTTIENLSTESFDLSGGTATTFGGVNLTAATTGQLFSIEDTIVDAIDSEEYGLVRLVAKNIYVTPNSFFSAGGTTAASIQRGIDAASPGDTVNVEAGTGAFAYPGGIIIDKDGLTLLGSGLPTVGGGDFGAQGYPYGGAFEVAANTITINGFNLVGDGTDGNSENSNGVLLLHGTSSTTIKNSVIGGFSNGILTEDDSIAADGQTGTLIQNNVFNATTAADNFAIQLIGTGGSGQVVDDDNTFNAGESGVLLQNVSSDTVASNSFSHADNAVIIVDANNISITANDIEDTTGTAIGLDGGATHVTVSENTIDGGAAAAIKVANLYSSTNAPNDALTVENNFLDNNAYGVWVFPPGTASDGEVANGPALVGNSSLTVNINHITGNTIAGLENDSTATVDATNNWWGTADGPDVALNNFKYPTTGDSIIGQNVTFAPWLADGIDSAPATPGFQHDPSTAGPTAQISTAPTSNPAGTEISLTGTATDASPIDAAGFTFVWSVSKNGTPGFASGSSAPGASSVAINFTPDDQGTYVVTLTATDHDGVTSPVATESITVSDVAPVAHVSPAPVSNPAGTAISLTGTATDVATADNAAGYTFSWSVSKNGTPGFASGSTPAGASTVSIGFLPDDAGTYIVTLTATDHNGVSSVAATESISVSDVAPVAAISPAPVSNPAGTAISLTGTASDVATADNAAGYTFAWSVSKNGTPGFASGSTPAGSSSVAIGFLPDDAGTYVVTLTATDHNGVSSVAATESITVSDVAPVAHISNALPSNPAGTPISLTGTATDVATADNAAGYTFAWSVSKNGTPGFASGTSPAGSSSVSIGFTPDDQGTYVVTLTATDHNGVSSLVATESISVSDVAPVAHISPAPASNPEGVTINLTGTASDVGTADDAAGYTFVWSVTKVGTGVVASGSSLAGAHSVPISFTPDAQATYIVTLTATDHNGVTSAAATENITTVENPPVVDFDASSTTASAGLTYTLHINGVTDPGPNNILGYFINWGDGTILDGTGLGSPAGGIFTHVFETPNTTPEIEVTVVDSEGNKPAANGLSVAVSDVNPTATLSNPFPTVTLGATGLVKLLNAFNPSSVVTGDGFLYSWNFTSNSLTDPNSYTTPVTSPNSETIPVSALSTPGVKTIWARIQDTFGGFTDYSTTITVNDVAPAVNAGPAHVSVNAGALYTFNGSFTQPGNNGPFVGTVDYGDGSGVQPLTLNANKTFMLSHTYASAGPDTITVTVTDASNVTGTGTSAVTVAATTFQVQSVAPTTSGVNITFNRALNPSTLALYGAGTTVIPDVTLVGAHTGAITGSLVYNSATDTLQFVQTENPIFSGGVSETDPLGGFARTDAYLPPDTYTLTLTSGASGLKDANGNPLDGGNNGGSGNFTTTFTVGAYGGLVVTLPDFARAPGGTVNTLDDGTAGNGTVTASGLPIRISDGNGVNSVDFILNYDPTLMNVTGVTAPSGWGSDFNILSPGQVKITVFSTTSASLTATDVAADIAWINATILTAAPYGASQVLSVSNVSVNEGAIAAQGDEAVSKVALLGDATGDGSLSSLDARDIARVTVGSDTGFAAYSLTDPRIVGDVTGDGTISGLDASFVSRASVGISVPEIPATFATINSFASVDPTLAVPTTEIGVRGNTITVPVGITDSAGGLEAADIGLIYNSALVHLLSTGAIKLDPTLVADGWVIGAINLNDAAGTVRISMFTTGDPLPAGPQNLLNLTFTVNANAPAGVSPVTIDTSGTPSHTRLNEGELALTADSGDITIPIAVSILDAPPSITYGTSVSLNATNTNDVSLFGQAAGSLTYQWTVTEGGNTVFTSNTAALNFTPTVGSYIVTLVVTDSAGNQGTDSKMVTVGKATPTINWTTPSDITYGTSLSGTQLDAASSWTVGGTMGSVAGNFVYTPGLGTILHAGQNQQLSVTFTPNDTADYTSASQTVFINVAKYAFSYTIANDSHVYGTTDSFSTLASTIATGVNGENLDIAYASVGNTVTAHVGSSSPITGTLSNGSGLSSDYTVTLTPGVLTVTPYAFSYTIANDSHVYGTTDSFSTLASTIATGVNGENLDIAYASVGNTVTAHVGSSSPITGTLSNGSGLSSDYTVTLTPGVLTVTPYAFSYTIANDSHVYGTTDSFSTLASTIATGVNGENLDIAYASVGNTVTAHVGSSSPITGTLSNGSGLSSDYTVTLTPGVLTVTPYAFSYTIANDSHVYGTTDSFSTLASTIATGVNGENLDIAYASVGNTVTAHVGSSSPITGTLSNGSGLSSDYTVTLTPGVLTVTPYAFSYTIANDTQTYGYPVNLATDLGTTIPTGVNGETLGITYGSTGDNTAAVVGPYSITGVLSNGSGLLSDYNVTLNPGTLSVVHFAVTNTVTNPSGVNIAFNAPINASTLNLYDGEDSAGQVIDLTVTNTGTGATVNGSLVFSADKTSASWVATGGILPAGNYLLRLVSGVNSWNDTVEPLNGTGGSDFISPFTEAAPAASVVTIPDFARGPGQAVDVPVTQQGADGAANATGLPITLSNAAGVNTVDFMIKYDPTLLTITGVNLDPSMTTWSSSNLIVTGGPGLLIIHASGPALSPGSQTLFEIQASVPTTATYGASEVLSFLNATVNGVTPITADEAMDKVAYVGDATGDGTYSSMDSSLIARVVVGLDSGFDSYPLTDPVVVGDVTGDGTLSGLDARYVARAGAMMAVPELPPIDPSIVVNTIQPGADPTLSLSTTAVGIRGGTISYAIGISDTALGLQAADLAITYNSALVHLTSNNAVQIDSGLASDGWMIGAINLDDADGIVRISMFTSGDPLPAGPQNLLNLMFSVNSNAPAGVSPVSIDTSGTPSHSRLNEGELSLSFNQGDITIPIATSILDAPANITYGTTVHLDASNPSDVSLFGQAAGSLTYQWTVTEQGVTNPVDTSNAAVLSFTPTAGTYSVTLVVTDSAGNMGTDSKTIVVGKATPNITWPMPANIPFGTMLSGTQLDATATWTVAGVLQTVPGVFAYTPIAGTVLPGGVNQTLQVTFTPNDTTDYLPVMTSTTINVIPALVSSQVGDGTAQRSNVHTFSITFNETVNFSSTSFTLYQATMNANGTVASYTNDVSAGVTATSTDGKTWTFTVVSGGILNRGKGNLTDGVYQLVLHNANITDQATGQAALGTGNQIVSFATNESGVPGIAPAFHVLFGDVDGDGVVSNADLNKFRQAFTATGGVYNALFDFDGDGVISNADLNQMRKRFMQPTLSY